LKPKVEPQLVAVVEEQSQRKKRKKKNKGVKRRERNEQRWGKKLEEWAAMQPFHTSVSSGSG